MTRKKKGQLDPLVECVPRELMGDKIWIYPRTLCAPVYPMHIKERERESERRVCYNMCSINSSVYTARVRARE